MIYARFSSHNQREASIEQQVEWCTKSALYEHRQYSVNMELLSSYRTTKEGSVRLYAYRAFFVAVRGPPLFVIILRNTDFSSKITHNSRKCDRLLQQKERPQMIRIHLSRLLGERRWTQADLSRKTGIRAATINEIYNELAQRVNLEHLDLICEALDCDLDELISRE